MRKTLPVLVTALMLGGASLATAAGTSGTPSGAGGTTGSSQNANPTNPGTTPGIGTGSGAAAPGGTGAGAGTMTRQGTVASVSGDSVTLEDGTKFQVDDPQMSDVKAGDKVTVTYNQDGGTNKATSVRKGATDSLSGTGTNSTTTGSSATGGGGQMGAQPRAKGS